MKITLLTSDNIRHNYLVNKLLRISSKLSVIREIDTIDLKKNEEKKFISPQRKKYFDKVFDAQHALFGDAKISKRDIHLFEISKGKINDYRIEEMKDYLDSDYFIVFGSSYIKGDLVNYLIDKQAINIHMGLSPFYRGSDCNFWAIYDGNPHLVGATIHFLSKGLDSGPILYHAVTKLISSKNVFEYTMSSVKSAFSSIIEKLSDKTILNMEPIIQDKSKEIRYSKSVHFTDEIIEDYFTKKINIKSKTIDLKILKNPYIYEL